MKLYFASDHAGFELKQHLLKYCEENGIDVVDCGPTEYNPEDDYPDWISKAAQHVSDDPENNRAIVLGLSGQGEAMVANKFPHVRAGVFYGGPLEIPRLLREHNNSNVLSLGAKFLTLQDAELAVDTWIEIQYVQGERHDRRIKKIEDIEVSIKTAQPKTIQ